MNKHSRQKPQNSPQSENKLSPEVIAFLNSYLSPGFVKGLLIGGGLIAFLCSVIGIGLTTFAWDSWEDLKQVRKDVHKIEAWGDVPSKIQAVAEKIPSAELYANKAEVTEIRANVAAIGDLAKEMRDDLKTNAIDQRQSMVALNTQVTQAQEQSASKEDIRRAQDSVAALAAAVERIVKAPSTSEKVIRNWISVIEVKPENFVVRDGEIVLEKMRVSQKNQTPSQRIVITTVRLLSTNTDAVFPSYEVTYELLDGADLLIKFKVDPKADQAAFIKGLTDRFTRLEAQLELRATQ